MSEYAAPVAVPHLWDTAAGLYRVPVRHHSPACAHHLRALLREIAPRQILVEGPCDFDPLIGLVTDPNTRPPVAIVAFPRRAGRAGADYSLTSYFPFCAHSPEYVALTEAARLGASARFIDLSSADRRMLLAEDDGGGETVLPLTDERPFDASAYTRALCERTGCRDQNELWDHLFETRAHGDDWRTFFRDVAAYCTHVRATFDDEALARDGTRAREAHMAGAIREAVAAGGGPVVVVTGGFHTSALAAGTGASQGRAGSHAKASGSQAYLIRYGFRQLDRLAGYAAGLPVPGFYDRLWRRLETGAREPSLYRELAADLLTGFAEHLRERLPALAPPVTVLAAALEGAARLASLRGRPGPTREDVLDACRSTLLKGEETGDATPVMDALMEFLTGAAIGDIPPSAGSPPLVEAARERGRRLGFRVEDGERRNRELDIYRRPRHREASRFLHAMLLLEAGFASKLGGPDFLSGVKLDLLFESWSYAWSPLVEARLIELAAHGESLEDVCLWEVRRRARTLEAEGRGRNAVEAVRLFYLGCQAGLQARALALLPLIEREVTVDPELASVVSATRELYLLWRGREVLGMGSAEPVERLIGVAYRRALYLLPSLRHVREERLATTLEGLASLREVVETAGPETGAVDEALLREGIDALTGVPLHPALAGAVASLAYCMGLLDTAALTRRLGGQMGGAFVEVSERVAFLRGLLAISRELLWRVPGLVAQVDRTLAGLDEEEFVTLLPHLRLTFANLDPRETDRLARRVAERHGAVPEAVQGAVQYGITEQEVARNLALSKRLRETLTAEGLGAFLADQDQRP